MFIFSLTFRCRVTKLSYHLSSDEKSIQKIRIRSTFKELPYSFYLYSSLFFIYIIARFSCVSIFFYCLPPLTQSLAYIKYSTYFTGSRTDEFHNRFFFICLLHDVYKHEMNERRDKERMDEMERRCFALQSTWIRWMTQHSDTQWGWVRRASHSPYIIHHWRYKLN